MGRTSIGHSGSLCSPLICQHNRECNGPMETKNGSTQRRKAPSLNRTRSYERQAFVLSVALDQMWLGASRSYDRDKGLGRKCGKFRDKYPRPVRNAFPSGRRTGYSPCDLTNRLSVDRKIFPAAHGASMVQEADLNCLLVQRITDPTWTKGK